VRAELPCWRDPRFFRGADLLCEDSLRFYLDTRSCSDRLILAAIGGGESVSAMDVSDPKRLEQLRTNIAERLRGVCAHMPVQEFDVLVLQIATVTLRYEQKPRLSSPIATDPINGNR
jgi:hypothetical protein